MAKLLKLGLSEYLTRYWGVVVRVLADSLEHTILFAGNRYLLEDVMG